MSMFSRITAVIMILVAITATAEVYHWDSTPVKYNDDIFGPIVPRHPTEPIAEIENKVYELEATTLKNDAASLTNSAEFVTAVKAVSPGGSGKDYDDEISALKAKNVKFQNAFAAITNIPIKIESEASIDDLKTSILIIKAAASGVLNN